MIYDTTITGVTSRTVNRKTDGKTITIYEISDANGTKWTTSRRDIAGEANRLLNQPARIQGRQEQRGQFTNYYLENIEAVNGYSAAPAPLPPPTSPPPPPAVSVAPVASQRAPDLWTEKDWSIMRQTAGKVSARISANSTDFWHNCDLLVAYFATGQIPPQGSTVKIDASDMTNGPQFFTEEVVAAAIANDPGPEPRPGWVDPDSDIPFSPSIYNNDF